METVQTPLRPRRRGHESMDESTYTDPAQAMREGLDRMNRNLMNLSSELTTVKVNVDGVQTQVVKLSERVTDHEWGHYEAE